MAFPTVTTPSVANQRTAAFQALYIKEAGGKWQTLGDIAEGVLNLVGFSKDNSMGKNRSQSVWNFTATVKLKQTTAAEVDLLDNICNGLNAFLFKLTDAVSISGVASAGYVAVTAAQVGCKGKLVADGTPEDDRHMLLEFQGSIFMNTANTIALLKPTLAASDFESSSDAGTFHTFGTYTAAQDGGNPTLANIRSCGVATLTLDDEGGASPQTISPVKEAKISLEMLNDEDSLRRFLPASLNIAVEIDWMATDNADLLLLDDMHPISPKAIITFIDGLVITLDGKTGIVANFESAGDMDKNRVVRFTMNGKAIQSTIDSLVS